MGNFRLLALFSFSGYKFDVIILDACPNQPDPQTGVFCPLKQMLDNPVLERMNKILAKNGTLIMNFIANMSPDLEKQVVFHST